MKDHAREKNNVDKTEKKPITTPTPLPSKLERNHSLDAEPKTLLQEEINLARVWCFSSSLIFSYTFYLLYLTFFIYKFLKKHVGGSFENHQHSSQGGSFENILKSKYRILI